MSELARLEGALAEIVKAETALVMEAEKTGYAMRGLGCLRAAKSALKEALRTLGGSENGRAA